MEHEADEEDDEEVVCVPEDLEVGAADDLHGGGDDEDEGQRDGHARQPRDGGEHHDGRALHRRSDWRSEVSQTSPPPLPPPGESQSADRPRGGCLFQTSSLFNFSKNKDSKSLRV